MLAPAGLLVGPEGGVGLVPRVFPQSGLGIVGAAVGLGDLVHGIGPIFLLGFSRAFQSGCGEGVKGQTHVDAVEPHLIGIDSLVPPHALLGSGLFLKLPEERLERLVEIPGRLKAVHAIDKPRGAHIVKVVIFQLIAGDISLLIDHLGGVSAQVIEYLGVTIAQVGIEHAFQFDAHHIAPLGLFGEIEHITLGHPLHLRGHHPLRIVLIGAVFVVEHERPVDEEVVKLDVAGLAGDAHRSLGDTLEMAVLHRHVAHVLDVRQSDDLHAILAFLARHVLHVDLSHGRLKPPVAYLLGFVIEIDTQHGLVTLSHGDIAHVDILDHATPTVVGLDAEHAVQVGRIHVTVLREHVAAAARDLRPDHHAAVTVEHLAVANDDIL